MAVVPITPILPVFVAFDALLAPGSITPITGISNSWVNESRAFELAVLQAITMVFTSLFFKNAAHWWENFLLSARIWSRRVFSQYLPNKLCFRMEAAP